MATTPSIPSVTNGADVYSDFRGLGQLRGEAQEDPRKALKNVAGQFEGLMLQQMLSNMRKGSLFEDPFLGQDGKFYREMYDQQLALVLSKSGNLGFANMLVKQVDHLIPKVNDTNSEAKAQGAEGVAPINPSSEGMPLNPPGEAMPVPGRNAALRASLTAPSVAKSAASDFSPPLEKDSSSSPHPLTDYLSSFWQANAVAPGPEDDSIPGRFESKAQFVTTLWPYAVRAAQEIGVSPQVLLAQAAVETGWGRHIIQDGKGKSSFNIFNIKAGNSWGGDTVGKNVSEYHKGAKVIESSKFRAYGSYAESFDDYVNFLQQNRRYKKALQSVDNPYDFLKELQKAGYATDPGYAQKISSILGGEAMRNHTPQIQASAGHEISAASPSSSTMQSSQRLQNRAAAFLKSSQEGGEKTQGGRIDTKV